jgi:LysM repeat protein
MLVRSGRGALAAALVAVAALMAAAPASGAVAHVVAPGESLWSVASANGISAESLASWNGLSSDALLIAGDTIQVPAVSEVGSTTTAGTTTSTATVGGHVIAPGESLWSIASANGITVDALASANGLSIDSVLLAGQSLQIPAATSTTSSAPAAGLSEIYSPNGTAYLDSTVAPSWNSMRDASLSQYGVDLYPAGSLSAYRTYDQQAYLYDQYVSGQGAPANPPGTSSHELGVSVDLADPSMRSVVDQIGGSYGWSAPYPNEWWHVQYGW